MDINFHYFAVKTVSRLAGFDESEAQIIAEYSEFIDDFAIYKPMFFDDVPKFAQHLAVKVDSGYTFKPVTTGYVNLFEIARMLDPENQKLIITPFHFMPTIPIEKLPDRKDWRVSPADFKTPSIINDLLSDAKKRFLEDKDTNRHINLIRIGMLLHTFADTYAHEGFSGYSGWENSSRIEKVIDNKTGRDITSQYKDLHLPPIAHTNVGTAPDDSFVTFFMCCKRNENDDFNGRYERNNTDVFVSVAKLILNYLRGCLNKDDISVSEWKKISGDLLKGFLIDVKGLSRLVPHWKSLFHDVNFSYNVNELTSKSDDFFHYNVIANEIREKVNGESFISVF